MPKTKNNQFSSLYSEIVLSNEEKIAAMHSRRPITELKSVMYAVKSAKLRRTIGEPKYRIFIELWRHYACIINHAYRQASFNAQASVTRGLVVLVYGYVGTQTLILSARALLTIMGNMILSKHLEHI